MLDSLSGTLLSAEEDTAVLDVGGMRFRIEVPTSTTNALPKAGSPAVLLTRLSLNVNEGQFLLFGFFTEAERGCFDILNGISGIGPRKALGILSNVEIGSFARAIIAGDLNALSKIKGVGKKTAERLVVELREKIAAYAASAPGSATSRSGGATSSASLPANSLPAKPNIQDAVQALMVLGCRPAVAEKAIAAALGELGDGAKTEDLVRIGLRNR